VAGRSDGVAPGACAWPAFSPPGTTGRSRRIDLLAHDPCVLTHLPAAGEAVSLEQLNGRTEQETAVSLTARYHFRDCLDAATAGLGDLVERAFKRNAGDPCPRCFLSSGRTVYGSGVLSIHGRDRPATLNQSSKPNHASTVQPLSDDLLPAYRGPDDWTHQARLLELLARHRQATLMPEDTRMTRRGLCHPSARPGGVEPASCAVATEGHDKDLMAASPPALSAPQPGTSIAFVQRPFRSLTTNAWNWPEPNW
jgi:hypothetical protein